MRYDCAELSDADIDAIVSQAEEETTAEINSFMVAARASVSQPNSFHSRQQRMGAARGGRRRSVAQKHLDDYPVIDYPALEGDGLQQQNGAGPRVLVRSQDDEGDVGGSEGAKGQPIKAIACHPRFQEYAVLWNNSVVRTFTRAYKKDGSGDFKEVVVDIKDDDLTQRHLDATCLGWSPVLPGLLAVGCRAGVMVWNKQEKTKELPAGYALRVLDAGEGPTSALAWSPLGDLIAVAAKGSDTLQLWDVTANVCSKLKGWDSGPAIEQLLWAPGGNRLLVTTEGSMFRVWSASSSWKVEGEFENVSGKVVAATWSRDGSELLFAEQDSSQIFSILFHNGVPDTPRPIFDTRKIGLSIASLAWDPTNERLAVAFNQPAAEDPNPSTVTAGNGILIFATEDQGSTVSGVFSAPRSISNHTVLRPSRLIHGPDGFRPDAMTFVHNRRRQPELYKLKRDPFRGCVDVFAMLCITWAGLDEDEKKNRVTFFPFIEESLRPTYLD